MIRSKIHCVYYSSSVYYNYTVPLENTEYMYINAELNPQGLPTGGCSYERYQFPGLQLLATTNTRGELEKIQHPESHFCTRCCKLSSAKVQTSPQVVVVKLLVVWNSKSNAIGTC